MNPYYFRLATLWFVGLFVAYQSIKRWKQDADVAVVGLAMALILFVAGVIR